MTNYCEIRRTNGNCLLYGHQCGYADKESCPAYALHLKPKEPHLLGVTRLGNPVQAIAEGIDGLEDVIGDELKYRDLP